MQYPKSFSLLFVLLLSCFVAVSAQESTQPPKTKPQRPTKFPTQFDKIIDTEDKQPNQPPTTDKTEPAATPVKTETLASDALVQAVQSLTVEVKNLVSEVRATNARQQVQTDILRLSRLDLRLDRYESELKTVRDRLALLETDYQNLQFLLTPEAIEAQVSRMPYANKTDAIRQVKDAHEARLRNVTAERELVKRREAELTAVVNSFREASAETEKRLVAIEEALKKLAEAQQSDRPKPDIPEKELP
ncbi:MAG TPA: hypothetical protein VFZ34_18010 [Blastocatellia bacterium]|nr:hypothetical protein [Blastocatellia bacterium]